MLRVKLSEELKKDMIQLQMEHLRQPSLAVCQLTVDHLAKALFDDELKDQECPLRVMFPSSICLGNIKLGRMLFCTCLKNI